MGIVNNSRPAWLSAPRMHKLKAVLQGYRNLLDEELAPKGISTSQLRILWAIAENPKVSGAEIARLCSVTPQSGHALLARMEANGWVKRHAGDEGGRVLVSELTAKGKKQLEFSREIAARLEKEAWAGVGQRDLAALDKALGMALERLERR